MSKLAHITLLTLSLILSSCAIEPSLVSKFDARQLVLVVAEDWQSQTARLQRFSRLNNAWQPDGAPYQVNLGRNGLGWGLGLHAPQQGSQKQEGDGKAPAGAFAMPQAFGYLSQANTALPYQAMHAGHYCMDVNSSPYYNQIIDSAKLGEQAVAGSSEPMRLDIHKQQQVYKKGIVVAHNPDNITARGSCIFMHLQAGPGVPTAGCTSMHEKHMDDLLAWLQPAHNPIYVALPADEYQRLMFAWGLPDISQLQ